MRQRKSSKQSAALILLFFLCCFAGSADSWAAGIKLRVAAEQANVREKPDITSPLLRQLPRGAVLEAERKEGEWYAVRVEKDEGGSVLGYVHVSLVVTVEEPPAEPLRREQIEEPEPVRERPAQEPAEPVKEDPRFLPPPVLPDAAVAFEERRLAVSFWLGGRYAVVGDLNDGAEGLARYYEARLGAAADGDVQALHLSYLFGVEARLPLAYGFHIAFGAEYGSGKSSSSVIYDDDAQEMSLLMEPRVWAVPLSFALVYYPLPAFYFKAGVEYTFAQCAYTYRLTGIEPDSQAETWQEWTGRADSSGFGFLAGLGYDWELTPAFSLTGELVYRRGRLDDFDGEDVYRESGSYESVENGKLYCFQVDTGTAEVVPLVFIRAKRPSEAGVMDARKAELSLSGFSLKLGIKVRF